MSENPSTSSQAEPMRIAIIAVHGVMPQIRFGFQDQVAQALCNALNPPNGDPKWQMTVVLPNDGSANATDVPTISRVHQVGDPATSPGRDTFDVHEAFWSPLDKGKTNLLSILLWLLKTVFAPFNDFARYEERPIKVAWDILYIGCAIGLGVFGLVLAGVVAADTLRDTLCTMQGHHVKIPESISTQCINRVIPSYNLSWLWSSLPLLLHAHTWVKIFDWGNLFSMLALLLSPLTLLNSLGAPAVVAFVCITIGSFLAFQVIRSVLFLAANFATSPGRDPIQVISRALWTALLSVVAVLFLYAGMYMRIARTSTDPGFVAGNLGLLVIIAVAAFSSGRALLAGFLVNFFGDVQIYTTRDQNSEFFALRDAILDKVTNTFLRVIAGSPAGEPYDRVYILAHSLGSTISMDALLRLYDVQQANPKAKDKPLKPEDWLRIRGFVTFGTALEKTKYFFNAWSATPSQDWEQWSSAVYGSLFSADKNVLTTPDGREGIYWHNNWFFTDFVADRICTYRSFLLPGEPPSEDAKIRKEIAKENKNAKLLRGRLVASNRSTFGPIYRIQTHTWYLASKWFWHHSSNQDFGVLDVLTSGLVSHPPRHVVPPQAKEPSRFEPMPRWQSFRFRSWETIK